MRMPKVQRANPQISQAKGQKQHPQGEIPPGEARRLSRFFPVYKFMTCKEREHGRFYELAAWVA